MFKKENLKLLTVWFTVCFSISGFSQNSPDIPGMVFVQGGSFDMGVSSGEIDEVPQHVVILNSFYIGKYEVTVKEYLKFCQATGSGMPPEPSWKWKDSDPIVNVSWIDAKEYCRWAKVRLPTEAEWEYASRGGKKSNNTEYSGSDKINDVAWYDRNSDWRAHQVGTKAPNELGIYDMSGNVSEWCNDWYGESYYNKSEKNDPKGPKMGAMRVIRGGSFIDNEPQMDFYCKTISRYELEPSTKKDFLGFRVVKDIK